jgi:hypothetical protein
LERVATPLLSAYFVVTLVNDFSKADSSSLDATSAHVEHFLDDRNHAGIVRRRRSSLPHSAFSSLETLPEYVLKDTKEPEENENTQDLDDDGYG